MSKGRARRPTFGEIVASVVSTPADPARPRAVTPGTYNGDGELFDPDGNLLHEVGDDLDGVRVQEAVRNGALVVWDSCGCGAYCNSLRWPTRAELDEAVRQGVPRSSKRHPSSATLMVTTAADGQRGATPREVVLLTGPIRWGNAIR